MTIGSLVEYTGPSLVPAKAAPIGTVVRMPINPTKRADDALVLVQVGSEKRPRAIAADRLKELAQPGVPMERIQEIWREARTAASKRLAVKLEMAGKVRQ